MTHPADVADIMARLRQSSYYACMPMKCAIALIVVFVLDKSIISKCRHVIWARIRVHLIWTNPFSVLTNEKTPPREHHLWICSRTIEWIWGQAQTLSYVARWRLNIKKNCRLRDFTAPSLSVSTSIHMMHSDSTIFGSCTGYIASLDSHLNIYFDGC